MNKKNFLEGLIEGCITLWEYNSLIYIPDNELDENNATRGELFELMKEKNIEFTEPFEMYYKNNHYETVPDDMIYSEQFLIKENDF